jgi:hypothetical protein
MSLAAVLAAIGVVWWQGCVKTKQDRVAAQLAGSSVLSFINQTVAGLKMISRALQERANGQLSSGNEVKHLLYVCKALPLPTREDLTALNMALTDCAVQGMQSTNLVRQLQSGLEHFAYLGDPDDATARELFAQLSELSSVAANAFSEVGATLNKFVGTPR